MGKNYNLEELEDAIETFAGYITRAWIENGSIFIISSAMVDEWREKNDNYELTDHDVMVHIAIETPPSTMFAYDEERNFVMGEEDILKNLADGVPILAKAFDQMGLTLNDPRFYKFVRKYIGKDPKTVVKHLNNEIAFAKEQGLIFGALANILPKED